VYICSVISELFAGFGVSHASLSYVSRETLVCNIALYFVHGCSCLIINVHLLIIAVTSSNSVCDF